jgi:hypothetical protein
LERIPILTAAPVEDALRRYVTANSLFESTCAAMLEREREDATASKIMELADSEFCDAGKELEAVLQQVVADRVGETLRLAGLMGETVSI